MDFMSAISRKNLFAAWGLFFAALLVLPACEKQAGPPPRPIPKVTVTEPIQRNVTDNLELTGNTQSVNTVQLRARIEGYLEKIYFKDGDVVKKGQPLFLIQQDTYQARVQQAEGTVLTQKARLEHAKNEFARFSNLYSQKAAPQTDVENWRFERDSAQAALQTAEAQLVLAKLDLAYTKVVAPFDGRIDRRLVDPGNLVGSGDRTILAEISQLDPLYVYFNLSENDLARLMRVARNNGMGPENQKVPVELALAGEEGFPHGGHLDFASTSVSPTTGTLLLRGVFPNKDGRMLPGQFARVRVPVGEEKAKLLIPTVAISFDQIGSYVMVVNEKDIVERRDVKPGAYIDDFRAVDEGLKGGERVVVKGILRAAPGSKVEPVREASAQQPGGGGPAAAEKGPGK